MIVIIALQTVAKIQNYNFLYFYSITLLHYQKNNQRIKRRDVTIKITQKQDYLLIVSTIAFPDYIKN